MNIIREDPPPRKRTSEHYTEVAAKLKADPGNWYRVIDNTTRLQTAANIKSGRLAAFRPKGSFDATTRTTGNDTFTVWARYVGEEGQA